MGDSVWLEVSIGERRVPQGVVIELYDVPELEETCRRFRKIVADGRLRGAAFRSVRRNALVGPEIDLDRSGAIRGPFRHETGAVSVGESRFFAALAPCPHLDDTHLVIGRVISGMEVLRLMEHTFGQDDDARVVIGDCGEKLTKETTKTSKKKKKSAPSDSKKRRRHDSAATAGEEENKKRRKKDSAKKKHASSTTNDKKKKKTRSSSPSRRREKDKAQS